MPESGEVVLDLHNDRLPFRIARWPAFAVAVAAIPLALLGPTEPSDRPGGATRLAGG